MHTHLSLYDRTDGQAGAWAARLAQCRQRKAGDPAAQPPDFQLACIDALWTLFDDDLARANAALAQAGLAERITLRTTGMERRYVLVDSSGEERAISISVVLRGVVGHCHGAFIGLDCTRLPIYVVPETRGEQVRWLVAADGTELTAGLVHDMFLSVFGDDAAATFRLSPLAGSDLFQTPWR